MQTNIRLEPEEIEAIAEQVANHLEPMIKNGLKAKGAGEPLLDVPELATELGVKPDWIYKKTADRSIPFIKVGRFIKFKKSEIDAWLVEQSVRPLSSNPVTRHHATRSCKNETDPRICNPWDG